MSLSSNYGDARMRRLGARLHKIYAQASRELTEKADSFFKQFEKKDAEMRALYEAGEITKHRWIAWRENQMMTGKRWNDLRDTMAQRMTSANQIAARYMNHELPSVYAHNWNDLMHDVESKVKGFSFDIVNERTIRKLSTSDKTLLPYKFVDGRRDVRWNSKRVNSQVLQGILQGEDAAQLAKRLQSVTRMNEESALRNARTAVTSAQNKGRIDAMLKAEDDGVIMGKEWIATKDERTREAHLELDRTVVKADEPFENEIGQIMYPGDPDADPANTYNCRCTIAEVVLGFKPKEEVQEEEQTTIPKPDYSSNGLTEPERPHKSDFENEDDYYAARQVFKEERDAYTAQLNEIVEKGASFERFETKDDFVKWAEEKDITIENDVLEKIDSRAFNETSVALDEMFERFPEVKSYIREDFDGNTFRTSFNIGLDDSGLLSANGGLNFNPRAFKDYEYGLMDAMRGQTSGFTVRGDGTFSSYIRHEFGHNVQDYIEAQMAGKYHYFVDDWRKNYDSFDAYKQAVAAYRAEKAEYDAGLRALIGLPGSSEYSNTNSLELFAEGFAEWSSGGKTEFAKAFGEFFKRWYK